MGVIDNQLVDVAENPLDKFKNQFEKLVGLKDKVEELLQEVGEVLYEERQLICEMTLEKEILANEHLKQASEALITSRRFIESAYSGMTCEPSKTRINNGY